MSTKRKCLTVNEKVEIIREIERGAKNSEICKKFSLSSSTVSTLWKNKNVYLKAFESNLPLVKKFRKCEAANVDEALLAWFCVQRRAGFPIDGPILKAQAETFAIQFGHTDFVCNNGWLDRFKNRHNIVYAKINGDSVISDEWLSNVWADCRKGYKDEDIYNADETGLFYNMTPNTTFKFKGENKSKTRLTVLVCANMTGTDKRKLFVIGKAAKPTCFNKLPVNYTANEKAWMTSDIFRTYISEWNKELHRKNRNILLLIGNCPAHPVIDNLSNIKLVFLPPNMPSILQPMYMGVIKSLKGFYKRFIVLHLISQRERNLSESVSVLDAINLLTDAWNQVTPKTISNCFIKSKLNNVPVTDEEEGSLSLSEWLVQNQIVYANDNNSIEEFVRADDNLLICGIPTDSYIADAVVNKEDASDDSETENIQLKPVPTIAQAQDAMDTLVTFFENSETNSDTFKALSVVRGNLRNIKVKSLKL